MIDTLPREVIDHVLHYLLLYQYYTKTASGEDLTGYSRLDPCNYMINYPELLALAHTCKYLQTVVYATVFKAWECHAKDYSFGILRYIGAYGKRRLSGKESELSDFRERQRCCFFPRVPDADEFDYTMYPEWRDFLLPATFKPQFHVIAGYKDMIPDALRHVQYLSLSFNSKNVPHSKRLANCIPKMTLLKEVTLNLNSPRWSFRGGTTFVHFTKSFASVIHQIKTHYNPLIVHTYLKLKFCNEKDLHKYLTRFHKSWRQWKNLAVETFMIDIESSEYSFPKKFCKMLGKLVHLKSFSLYIGDKSKPFESTVYITDPMEIVKWVTMLPKLQDFFVRHPYRKPTASRTTFSQFLLQEKRAFPSNIQKLSWPIFNADLFKFYNNFDSITVLEAFDTPSLETINVSIPPLPSLQTLTLDRCDWIHFEPLLEHCVDHSPCLERLVIRACEGDLTEAKAPKLLARIKRVELYQFSSLDPEGVKTNFRFRMIVRNAPRLEHLSYYYPADSANGLPWEWFEEHIRNNGTLLKTIHFRPSIEPYNCSCSLEKWYELKNIQDFAPNTPGGILEQVVSGSMSDFFILDVQQLLKKIGLCAR